MNSMTDSTKQSLTKASENSICRLETEAIVLLGAPGVGKGTQAKALSKALGIPNISTGELLRANVSDGTRLGSAVKGIMSRGDLVPDSLVKEMVEIRLLESDTARGYILDGFPRTLDQAMWLSASAAAPRKGLKILAICIEVSRSQLLRRITGRRYCPLCQATFNIYEKRPRNEGVCDLDGSTLIQRPDDTDETFIRRLDLHDRLTSPVIEHFRTSGRLVEIPGDGPVECITEQILGAYKWRYMSKSISDGSVEKMSQGKGARCK
jgi:adenylate kinase